MDKNSLYRLAESNKKLMKAEEDFRKSLAYDNGTTVRKSSDRYYDLGGVLGGINSIGKSVLDDSLETTYDELKARKDYNNRSVLSGISDNNALLSAMDNLQWGQTYDTKDFRSASLFDDLGDTVMGGVSVGLATGSPWGIAGGAAAVGANKIINRLRAKKERDKANDDLENFNARLSNMLSNTASNVDALNDRRMLETYFNSAAFGGTLSTHGADFNNGLTQINEGGTHESNPNEGVPAGIDENGIPNLVEEGEVVWNNDYVFSNRLKVPKKLREKYHLNDPITYADAIKKLTKESEERKNDPISNDTTKAIVNEFIESQEYMRGKKQQRAAARLQQAQLENDFLSELAGIGQPSSPMDLQIPVQQQPNDLPVIESSAYGGHKFIKGGPKIGYDKNINGAEFESQQYYQDFLNYMRNPDNAEFAQQWIAKMNNDPALNGYRITDLDDWYRLATDGKVGPIHNATLNAATQWVNSGFGHPRVENNLGELLDEYNNSLMGRRVGVTTLDVPQVPPSDYTNDDNTDINDSNTGEDWLRKAPVIGSTLGALNSLFGSPDYTEANAILDAAARVGSPVSVPVETIGDYVQRRPFDERYLVNMANQNRAAASRSIANTSGGNRAMQLGADYFLAHSNQQDLGEIMRQAYLANRQDALSTAEFNRGTNLQNMSAINQRNMAQAQLNTQRQQAGLSAEMSARNMRQGIKDTYNATTAQNLSNMFENMGLLGRERNTDRTIQSMVDEGYFQYGYNPDGSLSFTPTEKLRLLLDQTSQNTTEKANGGTIKKKRRF